MLFKRAHREEKPHRGHFSEPVYRIFSREFQPLQAGQLVRPRKLVRFGDGDQPLSGPQRHRHGKDSLQLRRRRLPEKRHLLGGHGHVR